MYSLRDKIVLITGASSGIGAACARAFAALGVRLILAARRKDRLESLAVELEQAHGTATHLLQLDVRDNAAVESAIAGLPPEWASIEVLVNNAGLARGLDKIQDGKIEDWDEMINTNVKGLLYVSRAVIPGMLERGVGHIINLGSIAGHQLYPAGNVYCASKYAVRALSESMRLDLFGTPLRVSSVDPGMVQTEFSVVRFHGDEERADKVYQNIQPLTPDDVADAIVWCATRPPHVNIQDMVLTTTAQASVTMFYRKPFERPAAKPAE